jgi:hypothetical protein
MYGLIVLRWDCSGRVALALRRPQAPWPSPEKAANALTCRQIEMGQAHFAVVCCKPLRMLAGRFLGNVGHDEAINLQKNL